MQGRTACLALESSRWWVAENLRLSFSFGTFLLEQAKEKFKKTVNYFGGSKRK
jgi:hypothetical protein